jgi:hypothetical protein
MEYTPGVGAYAQFHETFTRLTAFSELDLLYYADAVVIAIGELQRELHLNRFNGYSLVSLMHRLTIEGDMSISAFRVVSGHKSELPEEFTRFFLLDRIGGLGYLLKVSLRSLSIPLSLGACFVTRMSFTG